MAAQLSHSVVCMEDLEEPRNVSDVNNVSNGRINDLVVESESGLTPAAIRNHHCRVATGYKDCQYCRRPIINAPSSSVPQSVLWGVSGVSGVSSADPEVDSFLTKSEIPPRIKSVSSPFRMKSNRWGKGVTGESEQDQNKNGMEVPRRRHSVDSGSHKVCCCPNYTPYSLRPDSAVDRAWRGT